MSTLNKNNLVAQSNKLIEARYSLPQNAQVVLSGAFSLISPEHKKLPIFVIPITDISEKLELHKATVKRELKDISRILMRNLFEVNINDNDWEMFPWVKYAKVDEDNFFIQFHEKVEPYLLYLKKEGNFTQYRLGEFVIIKGLYGRRIYPILKKNYLQKKYKFEYSLLELRKKFFFDKADTKYKAFRDFKKRVLNSAMNDMSEIIGFDTDGKTPLYNSDLNFTYETRRTGRKISHLIFTIKQQRTKPTKIINPDEDTKGTLSPIILEYHKFGITTDQVKPFLEERGEEALRLTLNKIKADHKAGKIKSNVPAYAFKLLQENAGQKTPQEKAEEEKQAKLKVQREKKERQRKREALKHTLEIEFGDMARKNFLLSLSIEEKADIQYKIIQELQEAGNDMFIPHILRDLGDRKVGGFLNKHIPNFNEDKKTYIQEKLKEKGLL